MSDGLTDRGTGTVNAFSIDVEDYFQVAAFASVISTSSWLEREYRVERNTERILALMEERSIKGTFFVLGWIAQRSPGLVRRIAAAGHEIASHGYSHQLIYAQSRETFHEETRRSKELLEDQTGQPVLGYRAASFSITARSLWALDTLINLGFVYDSSIFPVRHDRYGIPDAPLAPGLVTAPGGGRLVEFPMATASWFGVKVPVSGGGYFRLLPYWLSRLGLGQINRRSAQPFVFYLHPWELDPGQPKVAAGAVSRFRHYTGLSGCESKLRRLLHDFRFAPVRSVLQTAKLLPAG